MAIEDTILIWWDSFLISLAETLAFDMEKMIALLGLAIIGLIVAKWGRGIIAKPLKWFLSWEKIEKFTKIKAKDIDGKIGWRGLLYHIPNLFRILILIGIGSIALDLLEFDEASGLLGEVFLYIPNVIAVVILLWIGLWIHFVVTDLIKDAEKLTFLKKDRRVPVIGFQLGLWGIIVSVSMTQLGIGESIIPILIYGIVGVGVVITYSCRNIITGYIKVEDLKNDGLEVGDEIQFTLKHDSLKYEVLTLGSTHIKVKEKNKGLLAYIPIDELTKERFYITDDKSKK